MRVTEYQLPFTQAESRGPGNREQACSPDMVQDHPTDRYDELGALTALGFSKPFLARHAARAAAHGTTIESEILAGGSVDEEAYYGAIARLLRLPFRRQIEATTVAGGQNLDALLARPNRLRIHHRHAAPETAIVPEAARLAELAAALATMPLLGRDLVITTPSAIRTAVWQAGADERVRDASRRLFEQDQLCSARTVLTGQQGLIAGLVIGFCVCAMALAPGNMVPVAHIALSVLYATSLLLKSWALRHRPQPGSETEPGAPSGPLPRYTVLVALYHEAAVAQQLIASLSRLDWPASLIEIKLVCEAEDEETIAALQAAGPGPQFEIVRVPAYGPRTKPKALTYALSAASGEFLAVYDAEDRPHPQQLREAYAKFRAGPERLACLQAPLVISNAQESWLSALFSLEYSGLFRRLLAMLGARGMPMPLGGTSNHFRTAILRKAGAWDPYNVTEDADMGLRLYRMGYLSDVIQRQTTEDAPVDIRVWMAQRSRWYKGWLQTWLVLMRAPGLLIGQIGLRPFIIFQLLIGGMLASALLHPLIIVFAGVSIGAMLQAPQETGLCQLLLFSVDFSNIVLSYLLFLTLGLRPMIEMERRRVGRRWTGVPIYWLMVSAAAWRSVIELKTKPFHWNKTPHRPRQKPGKGG